MPLARRTRMVSVRLSQKEFELLKERCEQFGERSLSDIAREAMYLLLDSDRQHTNGALAPANGKPEHTVDTRVTGLEARLENLQYEVFRLHRLVENLCKSH